MKVAPKNGKKRKIKEEVAVQQKNALDKFINPGGSKKSAETQVREKDKPDETGNVGGEDKVGTLNDAGEKHSVDDVGDASTSDEHQIREFRF